MRVCSPPLRIVCSLVVCIDLSLNQVFVHVMFAPLQKPHPTVAAGLARYPANRRGLLPHRSLQACFAANVHSAAVVTVN